MRAGILHRGGIHSGQTKQPANGRETREVWAWTCQGKLSSVVWGVGIGVQICPCCQCRHSACLSGARHMSAAVPNHMSIAVGRLASNGRT
jgi:hypothetical protein